MNEVDVCPGTNPQGKGRKGNDEAANILLDHASMKLLFADIDTDIEQGGGLSEEQKLRNTELKRNTSLVTKLVVPPTSRSPYIPFHLPVEEKPPLKP